MEWDSVALNRRVFVINKLKIHNKIAARHELHELILKFEDSNISLVTCRLHHEAIFESMILEDLGFRFIEMVLHPFCSSISERKFAQDKKVVLAEANSLDIPKLSSIAESAFRHERFYYDYRLPKTTNDLRYKNWVIAADRDFDQKIIKLSVESEIVAFFIVEEDAKKKVAYWHLTAVDPTRHGKGLGEKCWHKMLSYHQALNFEKVETTIAARNTPVLNLYSKLNFRFQEPEMTFHWVNKNDFDS